jgi:hypothetical protein
METTAQIVKLEDLRKISLPAKKDSINNYLSEIGYFQTAAAMQIYQKQVRYGDCWIFSTGGEKNEGQISKIIKYHDASAWKIGFETVSPFIYSELVNELVKHGFERVQASATADNVEIILSNGNEKISIQPFTEKSKMKYILQYSPGDELAINTQTRSKARTAIPAKMTHASAKSVASIAATGSRKTVIRSEKSPLLKTRKKIHRRRAERAKKVRKAIED